MRWHVCPYCTKEFRKPSDLVRHIRIHTHEKPFKCPQCFRAFAVKSTLTAHVKTHSGVKAFKCQCCMKSFSTSGSLKVHVRLHTGTGLPPQVVPGGVCAGGWACGAPVALYFSECDRDLLRAGHTAHAVEQSPRDLGPHGADGPKRER